jgi:small-conductance mechanosensitive channel
MFSNSAESSRSHCLRLAMLCLMLTLAWVSSTAQDDNPEPPPPNQAPAAEVKTAPVKLDGEVLFTVRGVSAFPADQRAQLVAARIKAVAKDRNFDPQNLRLEDVQFSTQIMAGRLAVLSVFDADARLEEVGRQNLARADLLRIQGAIESYRQERQPKVLIEHAALALASALALFVFLFVGLKLVRRGLVELEHRYKHRIRELGIQGLKVLPAERLWLAAIAALKFLAAAAGVVATYATLAYILSLFPWTRELSNNLSGFVLNPLNTIINKFVATIPDLIFLLVLGVITYYLLKFIRLIFVSIETEKITISSFDPTWARPTYRLVRGFVIAFAVVVAFPYIPGSSTQAFKGVSLFIGLVFSLGSTSLIGNLISGYSLTYRRAFRTGDRVKIGNYVGNVHDSKLLVTYLHTLKNEVIAVPNSAIVNSEVVNYSSLARTEGLILHTTVGIGYETPWRQVEAMLLEAAARTSGLRSEPKPFVLERELRSFDVEYEINAYCDNPQAIESLYTALHRNILDLFNEYGVQIMTPAYVADPAEAKVVARDQWYATPAAADSHGSEKKIPSGRDWGTG